MPKLVGYHRPTSVQDALALLAEPGTAVLAGGTRLNATRDGDRFVAVDLQALGLSTVVAAGPDRLRIGAGTTLQQVVDAPAVPEGLRDLARRELPSTLRTLATVGGTIAVREASSAFVAGLLVHDATVSIAGGDGETDVPLASLLTSGIAAGSLVTAVTISTDGAFACERTGRTPADSPIVAACARRDSVGVARVALAGVAATPILCDDPSTLTPVGDFLGSSDYRRHVAAVLAARVRQAVGG